MSDERAKRFPLALADLVREPRKPAARGQDTRGKQAAVSAVKPAAAAPVKPGSSRAASVPMKNPATAAASAKPASSVFPARPVAKPAIGVAKPVPGAGKSAAPAHHASHALRTATRPAERDANAAATATRKGAPNVALASTQTLTSERVRERMVERLRSNGVTDPRVLNAMSVVPRHMFVDPGLAAQAYEDAALPIGHHQTISKPSVVARMIELVATGRALNKVLEIGTGCGYQAAVLSQVATEVYSIERVRPLSERAKLNLRPLRVPNIRLHYGDGRLGLPAAAPFDAIVIACAGLDVPQALLDQLAVGGRLVAPVGSQAAQSQVLTLVTRVSASQWREEQLDRVFFVPLKSGVI
ncbi:protein-L-isoaspartate O-methyltransferase [Caballeronia fortuita]|uniref:Protein-L-isoaspartate O-methyltransferase n=1 Tax=Caballeronia fortuita TaxID=1777138 RepID=A0A158E576_9BURK|nr:protein-L-isoaspartate(D-aspartate) O-methyltransferase [Caballeronia fortuita]SAL02025.1 protein-L-isoaspartate O-methyltransferase [Caballeronia fortuita]